MRGPAQTPCACRLSAISWGAKSVHSTSSRMGSPAIRSLIVCCTRWSNSGCLASVFLRPPPCLRTRLPRIIGQLLELSYALVNGLGIAAQDVRNVRDPAMSQCQRFDGCKASAVLFREALVVLPQQLFDFWSVVLLKGKRHDGSSSNQVLQEMGRLTE